MSEDFPVGPLPYLAQPGALHVCENEGHVIANRTDIAQMICYALPFAQHSAQILGPGGDGAAARPFHGLTGRPGMGHRGVAGNPCRESSERVRIAASSAPDTNVEPMPRRIMGPKPVGTFAPRIR